MKKFMFCSAALSGLLFFGNAYAEDYIITLQDNRFLPKELTIPAGQKVKITVKNMSTAPAEFESSALNREKVISANSEAIIFIGPLSPGSYSYFNEFHNETTGTIIVK